ncbi:hypothetical protein BGX29_005755 [Mortierella sp. GBA35]|nr:hypothetical protein BGX29_005755 [Mortierella sp. GBA35]
MTIDSESQYLRWSVPVPVFGSSYRDIVLGLKVKDLQISYIEAIIVTLEQTIGRRFYSTSEVFTPAELDQLCRSTILPPTTSIVKDHDSDGERDIMKWKLKERLLESEGSCRLVLEVKTWDGAPSDYGSIEVHFVETHSDSRSFYLNDPSYGEHRPFLYSLDTMNTGLPEMDGLFAGTKFVHSYVYSKEGTHLAIDLRSKAGRFIQLWQFRPLPAARAATATTTKTTKTAAVAPDSQVFSDPIRDISHLMDNWTMEEQGKETGTEEKEFRPMVIAWMYFADRDEELPIDLALSFDGTQLAILDRSGLYNQQRGERQGEEEEEEEDKEEEDQESCTAVYRYSPENVGTGEFPPEATAGSGFVRVNVGETCPGFVGFSGRAEFHIIATTDQNLKEELLVACDGVTIEIYSVFGVWSHLRTIVIDPVENSPSHRRDVNVALFKLLRGKYLVLVDAEGTKVSTWDIEAGVEVSSCTTFSPFETWCLRHTATASRDGKLIVVPGVKSVGVFETTTWKVVGWYRFPNVGARDFVGEALLIRNDTQIIVSIDWDEHPLHQRNRGYVIDLASMKVMERYVAAGNDNFEVLPMGKDCEEEGQLILSVGNSSASVFRFEDRLLLAPQASRDDE